MPADVYTAREIAAAAGVPDAWVQHLLARGEIRSVASEMPSDAPVDPALTRFVSHDEAVRVVAALAAGLPVARPAAPGLLGRNLFGPPPAAARPAALPLALSTSLHGLIAVTVLFVGSLTLAKADAPTDALPPAEPVRLVFVASPGPGGGGGGGGLRMKAPPPRAERRGNASISSPLPARRVPPPPEARPRVVEPPRRPSTPRPCPRSWPRSRRGRRTRRIATACWRGSRKWRCPAPARATEAGRAPARARVSARARIGSRRGLGRRHRRRALPPGQRRRSAAPAQEVRADYSDAARRANLEGEVVLEIVVRRDGSVGDVKVLQGLGLDLNQRAIQAVRQWRFAPARLKGVPVDVVVEVAVEFRLR